MASDINCCFFTGRAGSDAEVTTVGKGGTALGTFSLAVDNYMGKDRDSETMWIRVQCWGDRSKVCEYVQKGKKYAVTGKLKIEEWEDKDGNKRLSVKLDADSVSLPDKDGDGGSSRGGGGGGGRSSSSGGSRSSTRGGGRGKKDDDDLPF